MRVPVYERREGIIPLPANNVSPLTPAGDGGTSMLEAAKGLTLKLQQIQNDTEDARTLELFNKFKRDSLEYHENPDKGLYNTRLGYHSQGVYGEADQWLRQTGEDYVKGLKSSRAKANFRKMAEQYIQQRGMQNSRFEADQMKKYQTEQADATYKNGLNDIALNAYNDNAVENIKQNMTDALELLLRYKSPEERKNALATMDSDIASARMAVMLQQDPEKADTWFRENKSLFNAQSALKYENALESYRVQTVVDKLVELFPDDKEKEGLQWIRENFSGDREEKIAAAYKSRNNESTIKQYYADQNVRRQQNKLEEEIEARWFTDGVMPTEAEFQQLVSSKQLRAEQAERQLAKQANGATRARIEKNILAQNPNLTQLELDTAVMRRMGITNEAYQGYFANAKELALNTKDDTELNNLLKNFLQRGWITTDDTTKIKQHVKSLDKIQKDYYNSEKKNIKDTIENIFGKNSDILQSVLDAFSIKEAKLNPKDKDYRQQLLDKKKKILIDAIDNSGKDKTSWFGLFDTKIGKTYIDIQGETLKDRKIDPFPSLPDLSPSKIDLTQPVINQTGIKSAKINSNVLKYKDTIQKAADTYGIEPEIIMAMIQQESGGNKNIVSKKGAQGLMQLMPKTAEALGVTDAFDPTQNINGGVKYFVQQLKKYGSIEKALWAYNAGPGNVDKGRKPQETRNYITNIMSMYRKLKGENSNKNQKISTPSKERAELKDIFNIFERI